MNLRVKIAIRIFILVLMTALMIVAIRCNEDFGHNLFSLSQDLKDVNVSKFPSKTVIDGDEYMSIYYFDDENKITYRDVYDNNNVHVQRYMYNLDDYNRIVNQTLANYTAQNIGNIAYSYEDMGLATPDEEQELISNLPEINPAYKTINVQPTGRKYETKVYQKHVDDIGQPVKKQAIVSPNGYKTTVVKNYSAPQPKVAVEKLPNKKQVPSKRKLQDDYAFGKKGFSAYVFKQDGTLEEEYDDNITYSDVTPQEPKLKKATPKAQPKAKKPESYALRSIPGTTKKSKSNTISFQELQ